MVWFQEQLTLVLVLLASIISLARSHASETVPLQPLPMLLGWFLVPSQLAHAKHYLLGTLLPQTA